MILEDEAIISVKRTKLFDTERDLMLVHLPAALPGKRIDDRTTIRYEGIEADVQDKSPIAFELSGFIVHVEGESKPLHIIGIIKNKRLLHESIAEKDMLSLDTAWDSILRSQKGRSGGRTSVADDDD